MTKSDEDMIKGIRELLAVAVYDDAIRTSFSDINRLLDLGEAGEKMRAERDAWKIARDHVARALEQCQERLRDHTDSNVRAAMAKYDIINEQQERLAARLERAENGEATWKRAHADATRLAELAEARANVAEAEMESWREECGEAQSNFDGASFCLKETEAKIAVLSKVAGEMMGAARMAVEAIERGSTTAPVLECLKGALTHAQEAGIGEGFLR